MNLVKRINFLLVFTALAAVNSIAQDVVLLKSGTTLPKVKANVQFYFLSKEIDTTTVSFVGIFKATAATDKSSIQSLYYTIVAKAKQSGANSFRLAGYSADPKTNSSELVLETYFTSPEVFEKSQSFKEKNVIYLFSSDKKGQQSVSFKMNDEKYELPSGEYFERPLAIGEEVKINKGGFTGATMWIVGREGKSSVYLSLTGFGVGPGFGGQSGVGVSFNTGRIYPMDPNLGELLTLLLDRNN